MTVLIVPAAGYSKRFNLGRPKMLLQHPMGVTMLTAAIENLGNQLEQDKDKIIIVMKEEFFTDISLEKLQSELNARLEIEARIILIEKNSESMVETIIHGIKELDVDDSIIIKDSDNRLNIDFDEFNKYEYAISGLSLNNTKVKNIASKSFLKVNENDYLTSIFEKKIESDLINVGLVKFESASNFIKYAKKVEVSREIYVSDVLQKALEDGKKVKVIRAVNYEDWGTQEDWLEYVRTYSTLFVDIDGVLCINENPLSKNGGWNQFDPITENLETLLTLQDSGKVKIIFTTSRSDTHRLFLIAELKNQGFLNFELITGLPHAKRILINDFSRTNEFPSALSINLPRNSQNLGEYLIN